MSVKYKHAEWMSLVEVSGPFLSLVVLNDAFPQGLDNLDSQVFQNIKLAYSEWRDNLQSKKSDPAIHNAWVKYILNELLEFDEDIIFEAQTIPSNLKIKKNNDLLKPDIAIKQPNDSDKFRLLINIYNPEQDLNKPLAGNHVKISPAVRMMELLHETDVRLGLVTNGEHWMLVNAPIGKTTGYISWYANLWFEEKLTLQAFSSLLCASRFFQHPDNDTPEGMFERSINDQEEVTDQLGKQVRRAVEILVSAINKKDQEQGRKLLEDIEEKDLYAAALTVMMRLVFLFCAEERELLLLNNPIYDQAYAIYTLRDQLREIADQNGEEVLERRFDAWSRLLATFRIVFAGIEHQDMRLPAYGGSLFDPDKYPFLEGRKKDSNWKDNEDIESQPMPVNNRIVLHLLESLQFLEMKAQYGIELRKLSFRALDIEQIGHVYEGLLDHTAVKAKNVVLGFSGKNEPEIELSKLEELANKNKDELINFLKDETGKAKNTIQNALNFEYPQCDDKIRVACDNNEEIYKRVLPYAKLIRIDSLGDPVIIHPGSFYVTQGSERRSTGTHYTPRILTESVVKHTLDPLVYNGPAEGKSEEEWQLKSAKEILDLKVCDFTMGSGAFLVQACRYLSEKLLESWDNAIQSLENEHISIYGEEVTSYNDLIPVDINERQVLAQRLIVDRCLYGVDKNPLAVEMAKLSMWLITMKKDRPFSFLDHALKCGDSLLGITNINQIKYLHLKPKETGNQIKPCYNYCNQILEAAIQKRKKLEGFQVIDIRDAEEKQKLHKEVEESLKTVKIIGDLLIGAGLSTAEKSEAAFEDKLSTITALLTDTFDEKINFDERIRKINGLKETANALLNDNKPEAQPERKPFHWLVEFPEIFLDAERKSSGFDAIVGNPPFVGGKKITGNFGTDYREYLIKYLANNVKGHADICAYFFLKATDLLAKTGYFGLLATNTISQGDTREVGLDQLINLGAKIIRAIPSEKWPGTANLEVAHIWISKNIWEGKYLLSNKEVVGISSFLDIPSKILGNPYKLKANEKQSFQGSIVLGMGFVLTPEEAQELIDKDPNNKDVLFPYLNGDDLNSNPDQLPSRWVINFFDWPLDVAHDDPENPKGPPYAVDYPDCLSIIEAKVKPERTRKNEKGEYVLRKPLPQKWWIYADKRPALYNTIKEKELDKVLITARVSPSNAITWNNSHLVFHEKIVVFPLEQEGFFALLQSSFHWEWARKYTSTLGGMVTLNYSPSDCFDTFPFPNDVSSLNNIAKEYFEIRQNLMLTEQIGLTDLHNRFNNIEDKSVNIQKLRELHKEMDYLVAQTYGWDNIKLEHDFVMTKQGIKFTISKRACTEILDKLLELNHQRYAEEVEEGLHDKKVKSKKSNKKTETNSKEDLQIKLF